jgi:hypothetical protein
MPALNIILTFCICTIHVGALYIYAFQLIPNSYDTHTFMKRKPEHSHNKLCLLFDPKFLF